MSPPIYQITPQYASLRNYVEVHPNPRIRCLARIAGSLVAYRYTPADGKSSRRRISGVSNNCGSRRKSSIIGKLSVPQNR